jgi:hypothetical protein
VVCNIRLDIRLVPLELFQIGLLINVDVGAGTVTAYFVDNGCLGVLVRLELYPDKDGPEFHFLGHELRVSGARDQSTLQPKAIH